MRQRIVRVWEKNRIMQLSMLRMLSSLELGTTAPVTNVYKMFWSRLHQEMGEAAMDAMGPEAMLTRGGEHPFDPLQTLFLYSRAETIYGGSEEVQRNIVGERALGLPREP